MSSMINGFVIISLITTLIYLIGLLSFITDHGDNKCDMTYMFEYPQFVRISNKIDEKSQKYGLYAYSEGRFTERTRDMHFDGIPVLFIPGNAGSYRQVRSLASVALRKAINSRYPYHFDYFCIDLNEELSGLNGALLTEQLHYVNYSMYTVLDLYKNRKNAPNSIVLFGHSMGGVIAAQIVANLAHNSGLVPILLTLSSPHSRHPFLLDSYSYNFYKKSSLNNIQSNTTLVSITGGYSDFIVPSYLTKIPNKNSLNVISTQIPISWLPADHLCILWCKQTILAINRALFDSVDLKTKQISTDPEHRQRIFEHYLVKHSGTKVLQSSIYNSRVNLRNHGEWIEQLGRQYSIQLLNGVKEQKFFMIRLLKNQDHKFLSVVAVNMKAEEWVYACGAHIPRNKERVCDEFVHLSHLAEISPSAKHKRKTLRINLHYLLKNDPNLTHVILRVLPTDEPVVFHVDIHGDRKRQISLPNMFSFKRHVILEETPEKIVDLEFNLPQLVHVIQSYQFFVESVCTSSERHATASLLIPWGHQNVHKHFVEGDSKSFHIRLYESKLANSNLTASIQLTLDPKCKYHISIRSSILGMLSQITRFYSPLIVANISVVLLMTLNWQLKNLAEEQCCSLFFVAVKEGAKPYYIITVVKLISRALSFKPLTSFLPSPDYLIMSNEGTDFFLLPLVLYLSSVGIVWMLGVILCVSMVVFETTVHKLALKFLAKTVTFTVSFSDHLMSGLHKIPFVVAGVLVFLTVTTTGSLALCVGAVFYFMRLTQLSQDYIEELVWFYVKKFGRRFKKSKRNEQKNDQTSAIGNNDIIEKKDDDDEKDKKKDENSPGNCLTIHNAMFFHASLFMIWCIVAVINMPSALTWAHNFKYSTVLKPDPAFIPGLLLSVCALPLWQFELPKVQREWYPEIAKVVASLAVVSLIYAPISIYRLNYILPSVIVIVTLHQLVAKDREEIIVEQEEAQDKEYTSYETIKAKLE